MTNEEIYKAFRSQKEYFKFGEFLENCIEWYWEAEDEIDMGILHEECGESDSNTGAGGDHLILNIDNS